MNVIWQQFLTQQNPQPISPTENILMPLTQFGVIQVSGANALNFLQGQLTCDIREVTNEHSCLGAYCTVKGRVLAILRIIQWQDRYYLITMGDILETTRSTLNKYGMLSKVAITDVSNELVLFGCAGQEVFTLLSKNFDNVPVQRDTVVASDDWLIINVSDKTPRFIFFGKADALVAIWETLDDKLIPTNAEQWQTLDIQAGIANIYANTQELFTPHMLNLDELDVINLNKGCYIGQEVIARTHYLGKSKRRLMQIEFTSNTTPAPGTTIIDNSGQIVGNLVDGTCEFGLAVLPEESENDTLALDAISSIHKVSPIHSINQK